MSKRDSLESTPDLLRLAKHHFNELRKTAEILKDRQHELYLTRPRDPESSTEYLLNFTGLKVETEL